MWKNFNVRKTFIFLMLIIVFSESATINIFKNIASRALSLNTVWIDMQCMLSTVDSTEFMLD